MAFSIQNILTGAFVPFSFRLGGRAAEIEKLRHRTQTNQGRTETVLSYDVYGYPLQIWLTLTQNPAHGTATWQITLRAEREIRDLIEDFALIDLALADTPDDRHQLRVINGGGIFGFPEGETGHLKNNPKPDTFDPPTGHYPPREFAMEDHDLTEPVELEERIEGRASYKWMPFWFLHRPGSGMWFGPEWSGSWALRAHRDGDHAICRVFLPRLRFHMAEGEEVALPAVSIGTYEGDIWQGCLHMRETISRDFSPLLGDKPFRPEAVYQLLGGNQPHFEGEDVYREIDLAAEIGAENLVQASSWYRNVKSSTHFPENVDWACKNRDQAKPNWVNWWETCGAFQPGKERFPDYARFLKTLDEKGMRLGLWCDPRVSRLIEEYSEAEDVLVPYREFNTRDRIWNLGLIDLGRREGRRYMLEIMERCVNEYGARWFWHDINVELCERYWDHVESPQRRGLMELRYILGMQEVYQEFRRCHPEVVIEWCASGGTMIDLGTLRFSHVLWISDYGDPSAKDNFAADIGIAYRSRLNWIFPAALIMNSVHAKAPEDENGRRLPDEHLISQCGGTFALGQALMEWNRADLDAAREAISAFKAIRHLLEKNFRGLFPPTPPRPQDAWDGWEFWDPDTGEGVLMLFRLSKCEETRQHIAPIAFSADSSWKCLLGHANLHSAEDGDGLVVEMTDRAALIHFTGN